MYNYSPVRWTADSGCSGSRLKHFGLFLADDLCGCVLTVVKIHDIVMCLCVCVCGHTVWGVIKFQRAKITQHRFHGSKLNYYRFLLKLPNTILRYYRMFLYSGAAAKV